MRAIFIATLLASMAYADFEADYVYLGYGNMEAQASQTTLYLILILAGIFLLYIATRRSKDG